jgi:hypothetical protein
MSYLYKRLLSAVIRIQVDVDVATDTTPPTAEFLPIVPDVGGLQVSQAFVVFSEPVTGVTVGDFTLTLDGGANLLTTETVQQLNSTTWTIFDLETLTDSDGDYVLTLVASGSGIEDAEGNALASNASVSWSWDRTAPTANVTDVNPDPRNTAVDTITVVFSEPIQSLARNNFSLTKDGGGNLITSDQTVTSSDNITWTIGNLGTLTAADGDYAITVDTAANPFEIFDLNGNELTVAATDSWTVSTASLGVAITPVSTPRSTSVSSVTIVFTAAVSSGFTIADLSLTRDGGANLLTGSQTLTSGDNITWTLGNTSGITGTDGAYTLTLNHSGSGIVDGSANPLANSSTITWTKDAVAPTATFTAVSPDPRNSAVSSLTVTFSEAVTGVTLSDFTLKRNGGSNLLAGPTNTVTTSNNITYSITGLGSITGTSGSYVATLVASGAGITDVAGNALAVNAAESWVADTGTPTASIESVTSPTATGVSTLSVTFSEAVTGVTIGDFTLTLDGGANLLSGSQTITGGPITYTINNLLGLTSSAGTYVLTLVASGSSIEDLVGNDLVDNASTTWDYEVETAWPGVSAGGSFQVLGSYHQNLITGPGPTYIGPNPRVVSATSWSGGTLSVTTTVDHLLYTGMFVQLSGITPSAINGLHEVTGVTTRKIFTIALSDPGAFVSGGAMTLWVPKRLAMMPHLSVVAKANRGTEHGLNTVTATNYYVPYGLDTGVKQIASSEGATTATSGLIKITCTDHGFSTGNIVEVTGHRISGVADPANNGVQFANGVWAVTRIDANTFTLDGSTWPTGLSSIAATGIVELHTNAVAQRAALLSGGTDNPAATAITSWDDTFAHVRSYKQAAAHYRDWLEDTTGWFPGYYFSTSNVGTPYQVSERGTQGSYPFPLVNMDEAYTNNWAITSSVESVVSGNSWTKFTLSKTLPAWTNASQVRAIIFNHSNPSYGTDQFLDKSYAFDLIKGITGTSSGGTATTLTVSAPAFDYRVLGRQLHLTSGALGGQTRTVIAYTDTELTVNTAFTGAIGAGVSFLCGSMSHRISGVSGNELTLRLPYRGAAGTGGCVMFMGPIATISNSGVDNGVGGTYIQMNTPDYHGLAVDDYVLISGTSVTGYNYKIASASQLNPVATRVTVRKVLRVVGSAATSTAVVLDATYSSAASDGWWFGTCQSLAPSGYDETTRIDQPDYRRSDVKSLFNTDLKNHIDAVFARDGARHIGLFDETSLRHASSAVSATAISGSLCGETSLEMINRIGEIGTHLRNTHGVMINPNCTGYITKDTLSVAEREAIISTWGGLTSEIACYSFDRSYHQMIGPDGWLDHISDIVSSGGAYYYQPQDRRIQSGALKTSGNTTDSNGGYLRIRFDTGVDPGLFPTNAETTATGHNHSGHIIGIYGHSKAAVNGVHRVRGTATSTDYLATLDTRYVDAATHDGTGGTAVYANCFAPMCIKDDVTDAALSEGADGSVRVTTEFPHGIPPRSEADCMVRIFGWRSDTTKDDASGNPTSGTTANPVYYRVNWVSATKFDLLYYDADGVAVKELDYVSDSSTVGICFHTGNNSTSQGADEEHWYGISYMLWNPGYALYYNRGLLNRHSSHNATGENVHPWLPDTFVPDGAYSVVDYTGTADSGSTTTIVKAGANFQDCCLGEQVAIIGGTRSGEWSRIVEINGARTTLTVSPAFGGAIDNTSQYYVGKTVTGDVRKVLELKRTFDGATKTVQVFPQKTYVTYTGFSWDTDA